MPLRIRRSASASGLTRQPGSKIKEKQDGSLEGLLLLEGDAFMRAQRPRVGSRHPDDPRAICYDVETESLKSGKIRVTAAYIGVTADPTPWFQSGSASLNSEPIATHPDFVSTLGGTKSDAKNLAIFDPETGEFLAFPADAPNELGGVENYLVPSVVYRFTRWTYRLPDLRDIGTIDTPPIPVRKPSNVKNFLVGAVTYNQVGTLYQETLELFGSGKRGWNPLIYKR